MQMEERAAEVAVAEHRRSRFVEVLGEGEVASSAEAAVASYMAKRVYQVEGNQAYTSAVEGVAVGANKVKPQEAGAPPMGVKDVATMAVKVYLRQGLST
jgi:hypothetical protein